MKLTAKTEYACIALLELAAQFESGQVVKVRDIAENHGIPSRFLVQILLQLKGAGLVASTRGSCGGYRLSVAPDELTLLDVVSVIEGQPQEMESSTTVASPMSKTVLQVWRHVSEAQIDRLKSVSFAELVANVETLDENMYYI